MAFCDTFTRTRRLFFSPSKLRNENTTARERERERERETHRGGEKTVANIRGECRRHVCMHLFFESRNAQRIERTNGFVTTRKILLKLGGAPILSVRTLAYRILTYVCITCTVVQEYMCKSTLVREACAGNYSVARGAHQRRINRADRSSVCRLCIRVRIYTRA